MHPARELGSGDGRLDFGCVEGWVGHGKFGLDEDPAKVELRSMPTLTTRKSS
jgi:hypothetical protein